MRAEEVVLEALRGVYDPELPVNIYDLGLIRKVEVDERAKRVSITMLFTSGAMCPVAEMMATQVKYAVKRRLPDYEVGVEVDFSTRWRPSMATPEGRRVLEELFGREALREDKIVVRVQKPPENFDPIQYMRERVEARYRDFREWLEKTRVA